MSLSGRPRQVSTTGTTGSKGAIQRNLLNVLKVQLKSDT
jgi:hypothetical protein